ncbi:MAG TPA: helix-turn-helix transcriptional regulator [Bacteroidia bacterium]|nr:helix-turn-helix transcriptional regulator [Bacteroidia bacterium]
MNLGKIIKEIRENKGINQNELAELCNLSRSYISLVETGVKTPNSKTLKKIGEALKVPEQVIIYLSIEIGDVPKTKQNAFKLLSPTIDSLVKSVFLSDPNS